MCPTCNSALKGVCGKVNYRNENGQKPCMILAACNLLTLKVPEVYSCNKDGNSLNHSSNSSLASDIRDSIDLANELPGTGNNAKVILVALWSKLAHQHRKVK